MYPVDRVAFIYMFFITHTHTHKQTYNESPTIQNTLRLTGIREMGVEATFTDK